MNRKLEWKNRIVFWVVLCLIVGPSLWMTRYTYPVQDDFHYAFYAKELMKQGYSLPRMAWIKTVDYYKTFCGCYTSSFLGYLMSGIINCNITGIRVYEFFSMIVFFLSCWCFFDAFWVKLLGFQGEQRNRLYLLLMVCIHGMFYFAEQEDYYWFITSVQYLTILSMILFGITSFIQAFKYKKNNEDLKYKRKKIGFLLLAGILGFLGSGAALNIAFLCCIFYFLLSVYLIFFQKEKWYDVIPVFIVTMIGLVINGVAPGNYIRSGGSKGIGALQEALAKSFQYTWERNVSLLQNPIFWGVMILVFGIMVSHIRTKKSSYTFPMPVTFTIILFGLTAFMIFPVVLGYGYDVYWIMCRSNFISDFVIYVFYFCAAFYWAGWLQTQEIFEEKKLKREKMIIKIGVVVLILVGMVQQQKENPYVRIVQEIVSGDAGEYAEFVISIQQKAKESPDEIVVIDDIPFVVDTTCLIDPKICIGEYDIENDHGNRVMAKPFQKKAIYYLPDNWE